MNQDSYIDPAEHIYDATKMIKRHLNDNDLIIYVKDFIWALESTIDYDFDGILNKCINILKPLIEKKSEL